MRACITKQNTMFERLKNILVENIAKKGWQFCSVVL
jgi:hypothetical protein